jgi:cob(I)alamin adenosyltransferase
MKVYTKTGDNGTTSLVGGKRVKKSDPRVEAYGDIDELISYLGVIRSSAQLAHEKDSLLKIQINLMLIAAHFASDGSNKKLREIKESDILFLESEIDNMTAMLPPQEAFILPGAPKISSETHFARTICRRAERHAMTLVESLTKRAKSESEEAKAKSEKERENTILKDNSNCPVPIHTGIRYLNRLSDYLFVLARFFCMQNEIAEDFWLP